MKKKIEWQMRFWPLAAILCFFICTLVCDGNSERADGEVIANDYATGREVKIPFYVLIDGNKWQIEAQFTNYKEFCWSDGTEVSSYWLFPHEKGDRSLSRAFVLPGDYPLFADPVVRAIWLAFASSAYLSINTNTMPALWRSGFSDPVCEAYEIRSLEFTSDQPKLPSKFDFVLSVKHLNSLKNMHYLSKRISTFALERAYNEAKQFDNEVDGHYEVASLTNFNGLTIPSKFSFDIYAYNDSMQRKIHERYSGNVIAIALTAMEPDVPDMPYPIWVDDHRFSDAQTRIDSIGYVVSNRFWPLMTDQKLQELFERKKAGRSVYLPLLDESKTRLLPEIFIGITLIGLPLFIFWRWLKRGKGNDASPNLEQKDQL